MGRIYQNMNIKNRSGCRPVKFVLLLLQSLIFADLQLRQISKQFTFDKTHSSIDYDNKVYFHTHNLPPSFYPLND